MDKWILSRLANCVAICNSSFSAYNFYQYTSILRSFWWYHVCDVYLERIKPVLAKGVFNLGFFFNYLGSEEEIETVRQILYYCLDTFLRLISPIMPFISEELWQRLPKRKNDKAPSLCVAAYPESEDVSFF